MLGNTWAHFETGSSWSAVSSSVTWVKLKISSYLLNISQFLPLMCFCCTGNKYGFMSSIYNLSNNPDRQPVPRLSPLQSTSIRCYLDLSQQDVTLTQARKWIRGNPARSGKKGKFLKWKWKWSSRLSDSQCRPDLHSELADLEVPAEQADESFIRELKKGTGQTDEHRWMWQKV